MGRSSKWKPLFFFCMPSASTYSQKYNKAVAKEEGKKRGTKERRQTCMSRKSRVGCICLVRTKCVAPASVVTPLTAESRGDVVKRIG